MMKGLRIAVEKVRLLAAAFGFGVGAACLLVPGTSSAFSNGSLTGGYGCLGHATLNDNTGSLSGISELMRLSLDGAGHVTGRIVLNLGGEVCTVATTGTYNVKFGGLGTMNLSWNAATGDADGDTNCATALDPLTVSQHTDLVVEAGGAIFEIQESDDFLTGPTLTSDSGDVKNPFVGTCRKQ
jgi:hypothetical protein